MSDKTQYRLRGSARCTNGRKIATVVPLSEEFGRDLLTEMSSHFILERVDADLRKFAEQSGTKISLFGDFDLAEVLPVEHTVTEADLRDEPQNFMDMKVGDKWTDYIVISSVKIPRPEVVT